MANDAGAAASAVADTDTIEFKEWKAAVAEDDATGADSVGGDWFECADSNELSEAIETSDDVDKSESSDDECECECECDSENSVDLGDCDCD